MALGQGGLLERRGAALLLLGIFVSGGLVFIFAGALTRANELEADAAAARAAVATLQERVDAGTAEIAFIETDTFVEQAARGIGYGGEGEQAFRLPADAPEPAPLPRLGAGSGASGQLAPLDAWLRLLFGS